MAEEEVLAQAASPVPSDLKRKLEDLEPEAPQPTTEAKSEQSAEPDADEKPDADADADNPEAKRPRLDEKKPDGLASENGFDGGKREENVKEEAEELSVQNEEVEDATLPASAPSEAVLETIVKEEEEEKEEEQPNSDANETVDVQQTIAEGDSNTEEPAEKKEEESGKFSEVTEELLSEMQTTSRKMVVPNDKVGVLIGKFGDTIRYLQYNSGAKIQITRDIDHDPHSTTREVEIIGTLSNISKAEKLINAVIAEADAGGSPSLVARGLPSSQSDAAADQLEMQVPNEKVGLIIGRGGDTIKSLQAKSGARIQLIPQHLPEGDGSKERTVRVTGDRKQIEVAREMIKDVMNQNVSSSTFSGGFNQQQSYRPRGPTGPSHWGPRDPHSSQPTPYDYHHRGPYPSQHSHYPPPNYGGYPPQQMPPRGNFSSGWEQRPHSMQGHVPHGGYEYYGGQGGHPSDHPASGPISGHVPGPSPTPGMTHPPSQANYNYVQSHGPDYGHQASYSQAVPPQQSYGHGYDEPKYDNHAPTQHPYGHGNSEPIHPQASNQPGYGVQQQYGKQPSYGMPSQGTLPQSYGPTRPSQPGEMPYQGPVQSSQSYGLSAPPQQQYPYASSGPMQQSYPPYGSTSASADGYNQAMPVSGPGYQQGGQPIPSYGQSGAQQPTGYVQAPSGGYGSYPSSQQGYADQPALNSAGYGYQGSQDPAYGSGPGSAYSAPPSGQQAYAQPTPTQPAYDQSVPPTGAYGAAPGSAATGYGKTVSPQASYPQYDSTQMYVAPR